MRRLMPFAPPHDVTPDGSLRNNASSKPSASVTRSQFESWPLPRQLAQQVGKNLQITAPWRSFTPIQGYLASRHLVTFDLGQHNVRHRSQPIVRKRGYQRVAAPQ